MFAFSSEFLSFSFEIALQKYGVFSKYAISLQENFEKK